MRVLPFLALLACGPKAPVQAAAEPAPEAAPPAPAPEGELFLWEVSGEAGPSYLFGTCHLPIPLEDVLPGTHRDKLTASRVLYTEVDMDLTADPTAALEWIYAEEPVLAEALGREDFRAVALAAQPMPASFLAHMTPMGAFMVVTLLRMQQSGLELDPELLGKPGLDASVSAAAAEAGVERAYLETLEFQLELLSGYDAQFLAAMRPGAAAAMNTGRELDAAREACFSGVDDGLEALLADPGYRASNYAMIDERNANWMPTVHAEVAQGGAFFAVGLMHLLGEGGVVERLRADGVEVTRVAGTRARAEGIEVNASIDTLVPEPPALDVALADAWAARLTEEMVAPVCDTSPTSHCVYASREDCAADVAAYMPMCVDAVVEHLGPVDGQVNPMAAGAVGMCLAFPATTRVMLSGEIFHPEDPQCAAMLSAMESAAEGQ